MSKAVAAVAESAEPGVHEGIKLAEVDKTRLRKFLGSKQASTTKLLEEYLAKMAEQKKAGAKFVTCNRCSALLVEDQQECPVCGDVDEVDSLDVAKAIVVTDRERELDAAVEECRVLKANVFKSGWELGQKLLVIHSSKLYLARVDPEGKPVHKDWETFSKAELGMSGMHARNMMLVSSTATKEQAEKIGFTKLQLVAKVNDVHDRAALFEKAKENASLRELMTQAKMMNSRGQDAVGASEGAAGRKRPSAPVAPVAQVTKQTQDVKGGITVVFQLKKTQIKLEKDPKSHKLRGREELANAVVTYYEFDPKTCVMSITREREE